MRCLYWWVASHNLYRSFHLQHVMTFFLVVFFFSTWFDGVGRNVHKICVSEEIPLMTSRMPMNGKHFYSFISTQVVRYGAYMLHWALATITLFVMIFDVRSRILWPVQFECRKRSHSTFFYAWNVCCVANVTVLVLSFLCSLIRSFIQFSYPNLSFLLVACAHNSYALRTARAHNGNLTFAL